MSAAAPPGLAVGVARVAGGAGLALALSVSGAVGPATAEVWPAPAAALVTGPFAGVEADALSLWSNPALPAAGPRWAAGASYLEPFGSAGLACAEAAGAARAGSVALSLGAARFGLDELAAQAWAAGLAGGAAGGRVLGGLAVRRHARAQRSAWACDVGLCLRPLAALRVAAVARSAVRAGAAEVAPETEWEMDAAWSQGAFAVALGLSRDAVGPLWSGLVTRADLGRVAVYTVLGRLAGGEARVGLGVRVRLPGGIGAAAGQEGGPLLPQSRAACVTWSGGVRADAPAGGAVPRPAAPPPPRSAPAPPDSASGADLDSLLGADARDAALDRMALALGEDLPEDEDLSQCEVLAPDAWAAEAAPPALPSARSSRAAGPPVRAGARSSRDAPRSPRVRAAGDLAAGVQSWLAGGLGAAAAAELEIARARRWSAVLRAAASRDPGEPAGLDESRASVEFQRARRGRVIAGAFGATLAGGLLAEPSGPRPPASFPWASGATWRLGSAARSGRGGTAAEWGVAAEAVLRGPLAALCFSGRAARDARAAAGGLWPAGGRYHRTDLEVARRGALKEEIRGAALEWSARGGAARAGLCLVSAVYGDATPRLLPDGSLLSRGTWLSACGALAAGTTRIDAAWALGPHGARAHRIVLRRGLPGPGPGALRLAWVRRAEGYAPAVATPSPLPRELIQARWSWRPAPGSPRLWLGLDAEEWAGAPARPAPGRHGWSRDLAIGCEARRGPAAAALEVARSAAWREPAGGASDLGRAAPSLVSAPWRLAARTTWTPPHSALGIGLAHTRRLAARVWRETWELSCSVPVARAGRGRLAVEIRPGSAAASDPRLESDPLGGTYFSYSRTPGRVTADVRFPLGHGPRSRSGGPGRPAPLWGQVLARSFAVSEDARFELWFTLSRDAPGLP